MSTKAPPTSPPSALKSADSTSQQKPRQQQQQQQQAIPPGGTLIPNRVFVGGIPPGTEESELRKFFSPHVSVKDVKIIADKAGSSRGYGFVTFEEASVAELIIQRDSKDGLMFNQRRINIGPAIKKPPTAARQDVGINGALNSASAAVAAAAAAALSAATTSYSQGHIALPFLTHSHMQQPLLHQHSSLIGPLAAADLLLGGMPTAQQPQLLPNPWLSAAAAAIQQQHQLSSSLQVQQQQHQQQQEQQQQLGVAQQPLLPGQFFDIAAATAGQSGAKRRRCADWPLSEWSLQ